MPQVYLFLINGFEEIEALATVDILRRAAINVATVSLQEDLTVTGAHGIAVTADCLLADIDDGAELFVIPGGTTAFNGHAAFKNQLMQHANRGKTIAAICAAPMVLGNLGLLRGKKATCYPSFECYLDGAQVQTSAVVVDGNIITARGPACAFDFALQLVEHLAGKAMRQKVAASMLLV